MNKGLWALVSTSILGYEWSHNSDTTTKEAYNYNNAARKLIRAKRDCGLTSQRLHTGPCHRNAYYFCDEVGFMVRDESTPASMTDLPPGVAETDYEAGKDVSPSSTPIERASSRISTRS